MWQQERKEKKQKRMKKRKKKEIKEKKRICGSRKERKKKQNRMTLANIVTKFGLLRKLEDFILKFKANKIEFKKMSLIVSVYFRRRF